MRGIKILVQIRWLALTGLLASTSHVTGAPGYLSVVGPPPLRFEPPVTVATAAVLPPLPASPPAPVRVPAARNADLHGTSNSPPPTVTEASPVVVAPAASQPEDTAPAFEGVPVPAVPGAAIDNESPSLQGLMKYFTRRQGTNVSTGVSVYAPLGFKPLAAPERFMEIHAEAPYGRPSA